MKPLGQDTTLQYFNEAIQRQHLAHAYALVGPPGAGKLAIACYLAQLINCRAETQRPCGECSVCKRIQTAEHPDVLLIFPSRPKRSSEKDATYEEELFTVRQILSKQPYHSLHMGNAWHIRLDKIKAVREACAYKAFEKGSRIIILHMIEYMNKEASNALLKILEEPPHNVVFFLTASDIGNVLPTIISRCIRVNVPSIQEEVIRNALQIHYQLPVARAQTIARISNGNFSRAIKYLDEDLAQREQITAQLFREFFKVSAPMPVPFVRALVREHDSVIIRDVFDIMLAWLEPLVNAKIMNTHSILTEPKVGNEQETIDLEKVYSSFPHISYAAIAREVENSIDLVQKNIYLEFILIVLINQCRKIVRNAETTTIC